MHVASKSLDITDRYIDRYIYVSNRYHPCRIIFGPFFRLRVAYALPDAALFNFLESASGYLLHFHTLYLTVQRNKLLLWWGFAKSLHHLKLSSGCTRPMADGDMYCIVLVHQGCIEK